MDSEKKVGTFLFLGTGASAGVPIIGCKCPVCTSSSPRNKRLRPSGLLRLSGKTVLIDVGPDFRQQALRAGIERIDGLMLTHPHYDHIAGIDDLRIFYVRTHEPIPCLLSPQTLDELRIRYYYLFQPPSEGRALSAQIAFHALPRVEGEIRFLGLPLVYFSYVQSGTAITGYRIGDFAYVSDIKEYDPSIFSTLSGVRTLVLSALSEAQSRVHFSMDEAIQFAKKAHIDRTWLMHVSHASDHETLNRKLPKDIQLAYDGLEIAFEA
ncbi:MAG: MBL fold metallo-hydrolase [Chlamydiia bacterium]|nr:MBL fold metallo-hydrolase [Chlamydiia bacterium]